MGMSGPIFQVGESLMGGKAEVYPNRVEYHKRTHHATIPVGEVSLSVKGLGFSTICVHGKSQTFEVEYATKNDYDMLQEAIMRAQPGESLGPHQIRQEQANRDRQAVREFVQDENVRGCGLWMGIAFVGMLLLGLIIGVINWVVDVLG